jgi:hypothetical protein
MRNNSRAAALVLAAAAATACIPIRPRVDLERGVSLASYQVFDVGPVVDETHYPFFPWPVADSLRQQLARRLKANGLTVRVRADTADTAQATPRALLLNSSLEFFRGGQVPLQVPSTRIASRCVFVTDLVDEATGRKVGQIVATNNDTYMPLQVLWDCARMVGNELARRVKKK